jgi:hypothetical protein
MSASLTRHRIPLILLVLVVAWGTFLRFDHLGLNTLASDEMNHYFVGQSLRENGEPLLPSGTQYTRGLVYSRLVTLALPRFDRAEVAVRTPSAVIGTLALILFAVLAWQMGGPWAAVFATILFALYPEGLRLARFGRFYTMQLLAGLLALYCGWKVVRQPLTTGDLNPRRLTRDWILVGLAALAFAVATSVQLTTISVVAGFGVFLGIIGIRDYSVHGRAAWRWSVPWQLTAFAIVAGLLLVTLKSGLVADLWQEARTMPMWARLSAEGPGPISSYYRKLSSHFPLVVSLSPLIFLVTFFRNRRLGGLLLAWFAVPILLHSFVFPWKSERYVLLAVPGLLLATGIAAAAGTEALYRYTARKLESIRGRGVAPETAAALLVAAIAVGALVTNPGFNVARRMPATQESDGWRESLAIIRGSPGLAQLPLGSAQPLVALHYWGKLDFTVQRALLESWSRDSASSDFDHPYRMREMGSPDVYAGRPLLTTPEAIRGRFQGREGVLIGIDQKYLTFDNIEPTLVAALESGARELCQDQCGSMRLYHWSFTPPPADSLPVRTTTAAGVPSPP